jgi:hypothetical protein
MEPNEDFIPRTLSPELQKILYKFSDWLIEIVNFTSNIALWDLYIKPKIMKKITTGLIIFILTLFTSCGRDLEQAKRYSDIKSETDSLISQANSIINKQKAMNDSLVKIRDDIYKIKTQKYKLPELDKKITKTGEIKSNIENVRKHLEAIKKFAENGEKATKRLIYLKRKYMTYATAIQVHDENIMIQEITDGLSAKEYISKLLPKEKK